MKEAHKVSYNIFIAVILMFSKSWQNCARTVTPVILVYKSDLVEMKPHDLTLLTESLCYLFLSTSCIQHFQPVVEW